MTPVELVLSNLPHAKESGCGWSARCPAHDDRTPSLSIAEGEDGHALVKCHAGCTTDAICGALGLRVSDLMPAAGKVAKSSKIARNGAPVSGDRIVATYDYRDEASKVLLQVVRFEPKGFKQRRPMPEGGWNWSVKGVRVVVYRLPELFADPTAPVFVVEGEKDVDNLARIGVTATCNAGGAEKWTTEHAEFLRGRRVIVQPDNDEKGRSHAQQVALSLHGVAESVKLVSLPGLPLKGDVSDWIATGGTKEELMKMVAETEEWTPAAQPWPAIDSFDDQDLPAFPTWTLPECLRQWVEGESHATQTPADLAGLLALAVCSAVIARRVEVEPRPGWREPVNLFVAVLLEPGNRKSAVFADALKPLREIETELVETAEPVVARQQSEWRQSHDRLKKLEKQAAETGETEARHEAGSLAEELARQAPPVLPRLIVDDATAEKLGMMLAEQRGRIASMSPEGGVFDLMAGTYSKNGTPQFVVYLKGHSGDDLVTDRVSRKSVCVEKPALTCAFAIQPEVIKGLASNPAFRGRGLLARFLYAAPRSWIGHREIGPTPLSEAVREQYRQAVRGLSQDFGNCENDSGPYVLRLTADAAASLRDSEAEIEAMLRDGGQMEILRDWGAKLAGATLRLAAVLHCVEHGPTGCIDAPTIEAAAEIGRYLIPHAEAVLTTAHAVENTTVSDARYVLRWIERHELHNFTKREAQQHGKRRFRNADDIDPGLDELVRRGYVRRLPSAVTGRGRPASPAYEVNPAGIANKNPQMRSHNSHNSAEPPERDISGNIGSAVPGTDNTNRVQVTL